MRYGGFTGGPVAPLAWLWSPSRPACSPVSLRAIVRASYTTGPELRRPPGATFDDLGQAIDLALARWDLSHLRQFTLEDGTAVVDEEMADELRSSAWTQTIPRTALLSSVVARRVRSGSKFT